MSRFEPLWSRVSGSGFGVSGCFRYVGFEPQSLG